MKSLPSRNARPRALACPASLKGVLSARDAAAALAEGLREWSEADELPVADGGEGSLDALHAALGGEWRTYDVHDAFGRPRRARTLWDGAGVTVEAAEVIPLDPGRLDPIAASSHGLGELIAALGRPRDLLVCLGGTANVDGGAGLLEALPELPAPTRVACDVDVPLIDAVRVFAAQKGATGEQLPELEARLAPLAAYADLPGAGAAGGLGAAFASLGAELRPGARMILDLLRLDPTRYDVVVTGEGTVDATTAHGKAPGEVAHRCREVGVRCVVFGGRVVQPVPGVETVALSGDPAQAGDDLRRLGRLCAPR
ncbi:MAG TPA: glycerate kinase [Gaiellaceae bacterium]|nr:glycerate kinase [Gaiellaceae bacterium]